MDFDSLIQQEKNAFQAKKNVEAEKTRNKAEILKPIITQVCDFLKSIQENPDFTFSAQPHAKSGTPLLSGNSLNLDFYRKNALEEAEKGSARIDVGQFSYGANSMYLRFKVDEDFNPIIIFNGSSVNTPEPEHIHQTVESVCRTMTQFFLKRSVALRNKK